MSELQHYYDNFCRGHWAEPDPQDCRCKGHGWALSEVDTWHKCPLHYKGQTHPDVAVVETESEDRTAYLRTLPAPPPVPEFSEIELALADDEIPF